VAVSSIASAAATTAGKRSSALLRNPHPDGGTAGFVDGLGQALAQGLRPPRVELDRGHRQAAPGEVHRAGPRPAELDPRVLELDQVLERLGQRSEAVLELLAPA